MTSLLDITPRDINDKDIKMFTARPYLIAIDDDYNINEKRNDLKTYAIVNFKVFNYYITTKSQPLHLRIINTLTYARDNVVDAEHAEDITRKINELKDFYMIKPNINDIAWQMDL